MHAFARILLEEHSHQLDAQGRDYLERIDRGAARLDALIRDVLQYTRLLHYFQGGERFGNREDDPLPTLVLLDLRLPLVTGLDVLKWIRNQDEFKSIQRGCGQRLSSA